MRPPVPTSCGMLSRLLAHRLVNCWFISLHGHFFSPVLTAVALPPSPAHLLPLHFGVPQGKRTWWSGHESGDLSEEGEYFQGGCCCYEK